MRHALYLPNFGDHAHPRRLAILARAAEAAGWDGLFLWDHVQQAGLRGVRGAPVVDPWIGLAACAAVTRRILLGPLVTPLARRRPWKVAREVASLDHLTAGRTVFGVGLGSPPEAEFSAFGENPDPRVRAAKLDEGLAVLAGLWSGEPFTFHGEHYTLEDVVFSPPPVQRPRVPVWVAGLWPAERPFERAARWDGVFPLARRAPGLGAKDLADVVAFVRDHREVDAALDVVAGGTLPGEDAIAREERRQACREVGATWWLEWAGIDDATWDETFGHARRGPPTR